MEKAYNNRMKKIFTAEQKAAVVLTAIKGEQTINQISAAYEVHPTQIAVWKKEALQGMKSIFTDKRKKDNQTQDQLISELYQTIGQQKMELEWLKKKLQPFIASG